MVNKKYSMFVWTIVGVLLMSVLVFATTTLTDTSFTMGTDGALNIGSLLHANSTNVWVGSALQSGDNGFELFKNVDGSVGFEVYNPNSGSSSEAQISVSSENAIGAFLSTSSGDTPANTVALSASNADQLLFVSSGNFTFTTPDASTEVMRLTDTGRLGIGTATPLGLLEINGGSNEGELYIGKSAVSAADTVGFIDFVDSTNLVQYGKLYFDATNVSSGYEDTQLILQIMANGTLSTLMTSEYDDDADEVQLQLFTGFAGETSKMLDIGNAEDVIGGDFYIVGESGGDVTSGGGLAGGDTYVQAGDGSDAFVASGLGGGAGGTIYLYGGSGGAGDGAGATGGDGKTILGYDGSHTIGLVQFPANDTSLTCGVNEGGAVYYNGDSYMMYFCNTTDWTPMYS